MILTVAFLLYALWFFVFRIACLRLVDLYIVELNYLIDSMKRFFKKYAPYILELTGLAVISWQNWVIGSGLLLILLSFEWMNINNKKGEEEEEEDCPVCFSGIIHCEQCDGFYKEDDFVDMFHFGKCPFCDHVNEVVCSNRE